MLILAETLHRIDPFAIRIWGDFGIRWYGLSYVAGFFVSWLIVRALAKRGRSQLPVARAADFIVTIAVGLVAGGRLGYCLIYNRPLLVDFSADFPFWGVFAMHRGGMASHGGIVGLILACMWFARRNRVSALHLLDLTTIGGTIGVFFGRIANFVNGELVGRACSDKLPWAMKFPQDITEWASSSKWSADHLRTLEPVMQLEPFNRMPGQWTALVDQAVANPNPDTGQKIHDLLSRVVDATQSSDPTGNAIAAQLTPLIASRHPSQIYQALMEGLALCIILLLIWRVPRKPGVIAAWFLLGYGIFRIAGEQFRVPDYDVNKLEQLTNITRGQWLSSIMVLAGIALLWLWARRDVPKIGGWGKAGRDQTHPPPARPSD